MNVGPWGEGCEGKGFNCHYNDKNYNIKRDILNKIHGLLKSYYQLMKIPTTKVEGCARSIDHCDPFIGYFNTSVRFKILNGPLRIKL